MQPFEATPALTNSDGKNMQSTSGLKGSFGMHNNKLDLMKSYSISKSERNLDVDPTKQ